MNAPECYIQYMYIACPVIVVSIDVTVTNISVQRCHGNALHCCRAAQDFVPTLKIVGY